MTTQMTQEPSSSTPALPTAPPTPGAVLSTVPTKEEQSYVSMVESIKATLAFSEADGRIVEELTKSCDELQACLDESKTGKFRKPVMEAQIISRRVTALKELARVLDDIRDRQNAGQEVQIIAMVIRLMKDAMREAGIPNEARELIVQNLAMKIEEEDARKRREARKKA